MEATGSSSPDPPGRRRSRSSCGCRGEVKGDAAENLGRVKELGIRFAETGGAPRSSSTRCSGRASAAPRGRTRVRHRGDQLARRPGSQWTFRPVSTPRPARWPAPQWRLTSRSRSTAPKVGLAVAPGRFRAGEVEVADIGLAPGETRHVRVTEEILALVPRRGEADNKYTAGSVLVVGGSTGYTGAPSLTAEAAMRAGAGSSPSVCPSRNLVFEVGLLEAMPAPAPRRRRPDDRRSCGHDHRGGQACECGRDRPRPGAERRHARARPDPPRPARRACRARRRRALGAGRAPEWVFSRDAGTVLTPHAGELGRLLGRTSTGFRTPPGRCPGRRGRRRCDRAPEGRRYARRRAGRGVLVCDLGNPGLATAGTGDVLTGIVAAFLAKGMKPPRLRRLRLPPEGSRPAWPRSEGTAGMLARDVVGALSPAVSRTAPAVNRP